MHIIFGLLLLLHGVVHVMGFLGSWKLNRTIPYTTTIFDGQIDLGEGGTKAIGIVWLVLALAFIVVGISTMLHASWWAEGVLSVATISLFLCMFVWPMANVGLLVNLVIVLGVLVERHAEWWHLLFS